LPLKQSHRSNFFFPFAFFFVFCGLGPPSLSGTDGPSYGYGFFLMLAVLFESQRYLPLYLMKGASSSWRESAHPHSHSDGSPPQLCACYAIFSRSVFFFPFFHLIDPCALLFFGDGGLFISLSFSGWSGDISFHLPKVALLFSSDFAIFLPTSNSTSVGHCGCPISDFSALFPTFPCEAPRC